MPAHNIALRRKRKIGALTNDRQEPSDPGQDGRRNKGHA